METYVKDFIIIFTSILYEALPFIVLGAVVSGVLEELVPQQVLARIVPRVPVLAVAMGALLGLIFPMCECGIIPVMRRLLRKGLPLSCCVAYMLAGPIINVVVILSTWAAFSGMETLRDPSNPSQLAHQFGSLQMIVARVGMAFVVAVVTGLVVDRLTRKHGLANLVLPYALPPELRHNPHAPPAAAAETPAGTANDDEPRKRLPWWKRLGNISETALHDFIDITVFLILGALLAAFARQMIQYYGIDIGALSRTQPILAILAMMGLAVLLCLCSEADAFVAASFISLPPVPKLAFLVLGPMLDLKLYVLYTRVFRPRLIWTVITCVAVQVFVYCVIVHYAWVAYVASQSSGSR